MILHVRDVVVFVKVLALLITSAGRNELVAIDTLLLPPSWRHIARVIAPSIAWLAPLPEDGRNECALSPT